MKQIIKTLLVLFVLTGLFACTPTATINVNPEQVPNAASDIADFDLPAGYAPEFTASLLGYTVAAYNPGDGHSHLYLIQSEKESDGENLAQMLEELAPGSNDPSTHMTVVETRQVTVRGQEAPLVISEGVNSENETYRQVMAAFQGKGGPDLLVLSEPVTRWDQTAVDAFLASIH